MKNNLYINKVLNLILGLSSNALFLLIFLLTSFFFLKKEEFSYFASLFIFENILIFFDLVIGTLIINSALEKEQKKIINFFFKILIIFSILFILINFFFLKELFWIYIFKENKELLKLFLILVPLAIIIRIFINFFRSILILGSQQILVGRIQSFSSLFKISILIFFLTLSKTIQSLLFAYILGYIFELVLFIFLSNKKILFNFYFFFKNKVNKDFLISILNLSLLSLSILIFFTLDRIFISYNALEAEVGEYNFIRSLLLGLFILGSSYYYVLTPELIKAFLNPELQSQIFLKFFKSLNLILIFITVVGLLFFENIFYDFKLDQFLRIDNFLVFKFILLASYFNILNLLVIGFQLSKSYLNSPTIINFLIIIISLFLMISTFGRFNIEGVAFIFFLMNLFNFFLNLAVLKYSFKKIFTNNAILEIFKNLLFHFSILFLFLNIIYQLLYNHSKMLFFSILVLLSFYIFYLSQKVLKSKNKL